MEEEIKLEVAKNVDTKDIELALQTDKKVDEAVVEKSLNYDALIVLNGNANNVKTYFKNQCDSTSITFN